MTIRTMARRVVGCLVIATTSYVQGAGHLNGVAAFFLIWFGIFVACYTPEPDNREALRPDSPHERRRRNWH